MDINIRRANPNEAQHLCALAIRSKAYWGYSKEFMESCLDELLIPKENLENDKFHYFVSEYKDKVVGYYALENQNNYHFELEALFVEPNFIGQGIGKALITHAKKIASDFGASTIFIQGDPNAKRFYQAAGGTLIGEKESASIPGRFLPTFKICLKINNTV